MSSSENTYQHSTENENNNSAQASNKKLAFFLPNFFTALNMACGFAGVQYALHENFFMASSAVTLGAIFDSVDGRIARMTGTQSSFGEQFDSMSDLISFGLAPSLIFHMNFLSDAGRLGYIVSFMFLLCAALRLARFNANIDRVKSDYFQGIPSPGAALAVIGLVFLSLELPWLKNLVWLHIPFLLFFSLLMISSIPFPSFKNSPWVKSHKKQMLIILLTFMALIGVYIEVFLFVTLFSYTIFSILYYFKNKSKFAGIFAFKND